MPERIDQPDSFDCRTCGTCCFSNLPEYIRVWGVDHDRLGPVADEVTHFLGNQCFMRLVDGHCIALEIDPVAKRFSCSIYPRRPDACRGLMPASPVCRAEIHEKGERPLLAIEALLRRRRGG
jgi:Fe-S-cluster containining protein